MTDSSEGAVDAGPSHRSVEIGVAILTALFGLLVIVGSVQAGIDWGVEGPKAGFFPFYIGLLIVGGSIANLVQIFSSHDDSGTFASWAQLRQVMSVVVPTTVYVAAVPWIGIYVASALLIGVFMKWIGRYGWPLVLLISIGMPVITFVVFERWFLVPLPKGPLEELLGL
jgi:putative tricarboxylic transport membrane protein